jgi:hypothetical protein
MAQSAYLGIGGGFASYLGDLQIKPFLINTQDPGIALQAGYAFNNTFSLRAGFNAGHVSAADRKNSPDLRFRNLSFESWISELNLLLEISPLSLIKGRFSPYAFGGIAVFRYNPYTTDLSGNKVYLQPLSTEGQGLPEYPYRKPYRLIQPSLPLGGGIKFAINPVLTLAIEVGYRKTFTDYIDDVSTTFIDAQVLQNHKGTQSVDLAFRTDELPNASGSYPASGSQRGDPRFNDWYTFYTTSLRISLPERNPRSCSCPRVR